MRQGEIKHGQTLADRTSPWLSFQLWKWCMHTMHLLPSVAIQPNSELKTWPKQLLGSLPLLIAHPGLSEVRLA